MTIVPEYGANLRSLVLTHENQSINCIDGVKSYQELVTDSAFKSAFLLPWPNRVKDGSYSYNDQDYSLPVNEVARRHAIHGFMYRYPFLIVEEVMDKDQVRVVLKNEYKGDFTGYPFTFNTLIEFTLHVHSGLSIDVTVENTDKEKIPLGIGWHPYFQFGETVDQYALQMPATEGYELDKRFISTGKIEPFNEFDQVKTIGTTKFDSSFRLKENTGKVATRIIEPDRKLSLECWQETGPDKYNFLQVYIPKHRKSLAIEPMTCTIDAFNNEDGLWLISPGSKAGGTFGVQLKEAD
jgi:aldose 1-epimerase